MAHSFSCGGPAAVDVEEGAGDEGGFVGGEIADHGGDFFRAAEAADGLAGAKFDADFFLVVLVELFEVALDERRFHGAGADGVDAERLGIFDGKLAGHGDDCALGGAVGEALLDADEAGDGGDVHDGADGFAVASGGEEQRKECAGDEVDGADVDVEEAVEVFGLGLLRWSQRGRCRRC